MATIKLGVEYEEAVHGIRGIATVYTEHLTGCSRVSLEFVKDGAIKSYTFDELILSKVRGGKVSPLTPPKNSRLKLGETYVDVTHGIVGVAIAKANYLSGEEAQICLESLVNGELKHHWFPESAIKKVDPAKTAIEAPTKAEKRKGGPQAVSAPSNF